MLNEYVSPYSLFGNVEIQPEQQEQVTGFQYFLLWTFQGENAPIPEEIKAVFRKVKEREHAK